MSSTRTLTDAATFGDLLKQLRRRAGMTQGQLAALVGFSVAMISRLEQNERLPDLGVIYQSFVPALHLQEEPRLAQRLLELAAVARGERLPATFTMTRQVEVVVEEEILDNLHLPALPVRVIGREPEVRLICQRLLETPGCLLTLVGSPGVGKTTLAITAAARLQPFFPAGVYFVPLATLFDPAQLGATLSHALALPESSPKPRRDRLVEHLRRKSLLLVLDNFEQLLTANLPSQSAAEPKQRGAEGARLIADLLAECPQLRVLITSREPLRLRAEHRQLINPLTLADAVALFVERAQAVAASFVLTSSNAPTVEAPLLGVSIHLRAQNARRLSIPEQNERAGLLALLAQHLEPAEQDRLIKESAGQDWETIL